MNPFENHAGFTLTSSKLQVVEVTHNNNQFILSNIDEVYFNEPLNFDQDKETKILSLIQSAYNELIMKKQLNSNSCSFTLPLSIFQVMQVPYDNTLLNEDLIEEFRWEFSLLYPFINANDYVIQHLEIEKNPLNENNTAIVIGLNRRYLQIIYDFCQSNNLKLNFVDNAHIASDRALFLNNSLTDKGVTLSVLFSNNFISVIFSYNYKPVYFRILQVKDAPEALAVLSKEINENKLIKIDKKLINSAFVTGEELSPSIVKTLSNNLGISFAYFNPFAKIKPEKEMYSNKYFLDKFNSFTPAAGIAFRLS